MKDKIFIIHSLLNMLDIENTHGSRERKRGIKQKKN